MRRLGSFLLGTIAAIGAFGQNARITFDVASIKPTAPSTQQTVLLFTAGGGFRYTNTSLRSLIQTAYAVQDYQLINGTNWMDSQKYDVEAKPDAGGTNVNRDQVLLMVLSLLADRFKLKVHHETKESSIYALVVAKNGLNIKQAADPAGGARGGANGRLTGKRSMPQLADLLSRILRRKVVDRTDVSGVYEFSLEWLPDEAQFQAYADEPPGAPANPIAPSLFTALQEQMGLQLESTRGPLDVIVIDSAEKPTEN
jgi:bla regulator protein blaR1